MPGKETLFPNTADVALFDDPRDAEVNAMLAAIPKDADGGAPAPERIFGSLPTDDLNAIAIPGLADDLVRVRTAWQSGSLQRTSSWLHRMFLRLIALAASLLVSTAALWRRRKRTE
jgi:hypothetical protein